jgi:outer membrane protein insertion porin family
VCLASIALLASQTLARSPEPSPAPSPSPRQEILGTESAELLDRPISRVSLTGLKRLSDAQIRPNLRVAVGQPFDPQAIRSDVATLYRLGQFGAVTASATLAADGTVMVDYQVTEQSLIAAVQTVGNKVLSDQELRAVIPLFANAPRDDFLVEQSVRDIKALYRQRGHYLVDVLVDESRLEQEGILIFRIVEGPRVRIRAILFEGNDSFPSQLLAREVKTKPFIPFFRKGQLDEDQLLDDVAALSRFYRDRGYVDVRVDRRIELSPKNNEAQVVFVIAEGRQYRVRRIDIFGSSAGGQPLRIFATEQLTAMIPMQRGDVFSQDQVRRSVRMIEDAYGMMGYVDTFVSATSVRVGEEALVDMLLQIREGVYTITGDVRIQGNFLTKDKVIRRQIRLQSGRPLDVRELEDSEDRLRRTRLFGEPIRVAIQPPLPSADADDPDADMHPDADDRSGEVRDVLYEIRERNTGSINFGLAVGTDSGLFGEISLRQDNFDIADTPESFTEMITGRAFRGAGQRFILSVAPGVDISTFGASIAEPNLFDSEVGGALDTYYRLRNFDNYTEEKLHFGGSLTVRLGDVWTASLTGRVDNVELTDIPFGSPVEFFEDAGPSWLTGAGIRVQRTAVDRVVRPSSGSVISASFEQVGAMGGDYSFPVLRGEGTWFVTVDEDFLGRRSTLRLKLEGGYIFNDDAPVYEKFYLGGRSFRGFEFRTISPKGLTALGQQTIDPIGGNWLFFAGAQYEFPIFGEFLSGIFFVDSGTVTEEISFDPYRVSVGTGVRVYIPAFGPVPFAFDFGWPLVSEELDQEQLFSFSAEIPF